MTHLNFPEPRQFLARAEDDLRRFVDDSGAAARLRFPSPARSGGDPESANGSGTSGTHDEMIVSVAQGILESRVHCQIHEAVSFCNILVGPRRWTRGSYTELLTMLCRRFGCTVEVRPGSCVLAERTPETARPAMLLAHLRAVRSLRRDSFCYARNETSHFATSQLRTLQLRNFATSQLRNFEL